MLTSTDSISLSPRNFEVWNAAAKKIFERKLRAVFIECSFDNCQPDAYLFGHLNPRHLYDELTILATQVVALREESVQQERFQKEPVEVKWGPGNKKRKRLSIEYGEDQRIPERQWESNGRKGVPEGNEGEFFPRNVQPNDFGLDIRRNSTGGVSPKCTTSDPRDTPPELVLSQVDQNDNPDRASNLRNNGGISRYGSPLSFHGNGKATDAKEVGIKPARTKEARPKELSFPSNPLSGLLIVVNHVKDTLEDDVDTVENIYTSLQKLETERKLGCTFIMARKGLSIFI